MMGKPEISIIIPIYNAEPYLYRCLRMLQRQTLRNIEIICVDDCSTDKSINIAQDFAAHDPRFHVLTTPQNSGQSAARNIGLAHATADNIMFCDADDFYTRNMCKKMFRAISEPGADMAMCGIRIKYEANREMKRSDRSYYKIHFRGLTPVSRKIFDKCDLSPCNKIFKREILTANNISFPCGLRYEDAYFCTVYFMCAKNIYFIKNKLYTYIRHKTSTMAQTFDTTADFAIDHLKIAIKLYEYMQEHNLYDNNSGLFWDIFIKFFYFSSNYAKNKQAVYDMAREFINTINVPVPQNVIDVIPTQHNS